MIANVIVNVPSSNTDQIYDYMLPEEFETFAKVGSRVKVAFGQADRQVMGYILKLSAETTYQNELKNIIEVIDYEPVLTKEQIELAKFIRDDAVCPLIRILNMMVPEALRLKSKKYLTVKNYKEIDAKLIDLFQNSETIEYTSSLKSFDSAIAREVKKGNILVSYDAVQQTGEKLVTKYLLNPTFTYKNFNLLRSERQRNFLEDIQNEVALTKDELIEKYEVSMSIITNLTSKGYLSKVQEKVSRVKVRDIPVSKRIRTTLDNTVENLLNKIEDYSKPILYIPKDEYQMIESIIQIINQFQKENKNVVIFTPEILTSYNIENIIRKETGLSVALINSTLSSGEILDYYNEIKDDQYRVIVTTSKGILFPFKNIGAYILLDSESDNYYSDQSPRYDLHKVIEYNASLINAKVIRTSLVPDIIEYTYGLKDYLEIVEDFNNKKDKSIEVVDLKKELQVANNSSISLRLIRLLQINKAKNKTSLLILNNKSYSSYVMCRTCGNIIKCPRCSTSLQYNKKNEQLICPACSYRTPYNKMCPTCNSSELKLGGVGIEQVEEELKEYLPNLNIVTLLTSNYDTYYSIMNDYEEGTIDILITTDLLSRSIDTKNIGLVGIINLDATSKQADYSATERAYAMLVHGYNKLSNNEDSTMVIQTYNPEDQFLKDFISTDYRGFIKNEIVARKILKNEPFYYVNKIYVKGKYEEVFKAAQSVKQYLQDYYQNNVFILGPTYNYQQQAVQLIIKHKINDISTVYKKIYENYQSTTISIIVDKYPKYI